MDEFVLESLVCPYLGWLERIDYPVRRGVAVQRRFAMWEGALSKSVGLWWWEHVAV